MHDTIFIVAPGPSLTQEDVNLCKSFPMIMIGNAWRMNKYADILYHCDAKWWNYYKGVPHFMGRKISLEPTNYTEHLNYSAHREGLDLNAGYVVGGSNSGYQAINLAVHLKPKRLILLGYDMKLGSKGEKNIDGNHPVELQPLDSPSDFNLFINKFETLVKPLEDLNITVYNCTRDSALTCFQKVDLEDVIRA